MTKSLGESTGIHYSYNVSNDDKKGNKEFTKAQFTKFKG